MIDLGTHPADDVGRVGLLFCAVCLIPLQSD